MSLVDLNYIISIDEQNTVLKNMRCGSIVFSSPEYLENHLNFSFKSDVYSIGIIVYYMYKLAVLFIH